MGKLYVVGTPIGNLGDFSPRAMETLEKVDFIAAEDTRVTAKLLNHFGIKKPMVIYQKFNEREQGEVIVSRLAAGESCAIVTDAGESCSLIFILGYVENPQEEKFTPDGQLNRARAEEMIARFDSCEKTDRAFRELGLYWENLLGRFRVSTPDPRVDRMVNVWNQYQCMVTFNMSRSASFFESGIGRGMGFRDSNQDLVGFVHQIPERARERILDIASTQFPDGACYHQYQPLTKRGNNDIGSGFNDDPLWLIFGTVAYLKETGDFVVFGLLVACNCAMRAMHAWEKARELR